MARTVAVALTAIVGTLAAACGSTSVDELSGPGPVRCAATLNAEPATVPPEGATVTVTVAAARDCTWSARADVGWVQVRSASGQGAGSFTAIVARSDLASPRSGGIIVNDQRIGITQEGRGCSIALSGPPEPVGPAGGRRTLVVGTLAGCAWTAESSAAWVVLANPAGTGPATLPFDVLANQGTAREASIIVGGQTYVVAQAAAPAAPPCTFTIDPAAHNFGVAGGQGNVAVTTQTACSWNVEGGANWVTVLDRSSTGSGTVRYAVVPNVSVGPRTTSLTIGGRVHTITQQGLVCSFTLDPGTRAFAAAGGNGSIEVNTLPGCPWTASSNAGWTAVAPISGSGPGTVTYTVQPNADATPRAAAIVVGGQIHTVTQAAAAPPPCTYTLDPAARSFTASGAQGTVRVTTGPGCAWTASSNMPWIVVAQGSSGGTGTADVIYTVAQNTASSPRSGIVTIGGHSHTITQDAAAPACTYALAPAERSFTSAGGTGQVRVTTGGTCAWTAVSSAPWVVVSTAGGTGTADIDYTVQAGPPDVNRVATITVNGQVHTVRQGAGAAP